MVLPQMLKSKQRQHHLIKARPRVFQGQNYFLLGPLSSGIEPIFFIMIESAYCRLNLAIVSRQGRCAGPRCTTRILKPSNIQTVSFLFTCKLQLFPSLISIVESEESVQFLAVSSQDRCVWGSNYLADPLSNFLSKFAIEKLRWGFLL